ncbi:MAG: HDOD domain-containing protein [Anaerotruncus sp.]|nr:HDOD domain-containing protein [Anaerotruncus sp.]
METYIVRQPILDRSGKVSAYEILYKEDESSLLGQQDSRVATAIEEFLTEMSDERFLGGSTAYLTFTPNLLMKNIPRMFSPEKLVIQINDQAILHPVAQRMLYRYKKQGYKIAIRDFEFSPRYFSIMEIVDYLKVDFGRVSTNEGIRNTVSNTVSLSHGLKKKVIAYRINTPEALALAKSLECEYIQGTCVAEQKSARVYRVDHMQGNFFQLMIAVTRDEPDIDEITQIISRDVTLAFSLMKLVNSAYFALRNQAKSVQQALVILGVGQLKQWIYLLSFKRDNGGSSDELIKTSFLRANFCQELSKHLSNLPISPAEAYLMGMFSILDTLMEVPLDIALAELAISDEIRTALLTGSGSCGELYHLVLCYESADWAGMTMHAQNLGLPMNIITQIYFECVEYVNSIWNNLLKPANPEDAQKAAEGLKEGEEAL